MTVVKVFYKNLKNIDEQLTVKEKEMLAFFALCLNAEISIVNSKEKNWRSNRNSLNRG